MFFQTLFYKPLCKTEHATDINIYYPEEKNFERLRDLVSWDNAGFRLIKLFSFACCCKDMGTMCLYNVNTAPVTALEEASFLWHFVSVFWSTRVPRSVEWETLEWIGLTLPLLLGASVILRDKK